MKITIKDWYDLHPGYQLELEEGCTVLVGPNGSGKSTLLNQLEDFAKGSGIDVFSYNNLTDGGHTATQRYLASDNINMLATAMTASEGQMVAVNFSQVVSRIGYAVKKAARTGNPLFILLDALDSGASIDRIREMASLFRLVGKDACGQKVYLVVAANSYELAKGADCVDVRTSEHLRFNDYQSYTEFIMGYFKNKSVLGDKK